MKGKFLKILLQIWKYSSYIFVLGTCFWSSVYVCTESWYTTIFQLQTSWVCLYEYLHSIGFLQFWFNEVWFVKSFLKLGNQCLSKNHVIFLVFTLIITGYFFIGFHLGLMFSLGPNYSHFWGQDIFYQRHSILKLELKTYG